VIIQVVFHSDVNKLIIVKYVVAAGLRLHAKKISMTVHFLLTYQMFLSAPIVRLTAMKKMQDWNNTI